MHGLQALLRCGSAKAGFWPALKHFFFFFFYKQYKECARYAVMPVCQVNRGYPNNRGASPNFWRENTFTAFFSRRNPSLSSPMLQDLLQLQRLRWYQPHLWQIFSTVLLYLGTVEVTPLPLPAEEAACGLCHTVGAEAKAGNTAVKLSLLTKPPGQRADTDPPEANRTRSPSRLRGSPQQPRPEALTMLCLVMSPMSQSPQMSICLATL